MALEKQVTTKYWKYVTWQTPILTSNNSSEEMFVSYSNEGQGQAWKAFDGSTDSGATTANNVTSAIYTIKFKTPKYINNLSITGLSNKWGYTKTVQITDGINIIGDTKTLATGLSQGNKTATYTFDNKKVNTLVLNFTGNNWCSVLEISIDANESVESTPDDYDYTTEQVKYITKLKKDDSNQYQAHRKVETKYWKDVEHYDYYIEQDFTPEMPENKGNLGGDSFAVDASSWFNPYEKTFQWHSNKGVPQWYTVYFPEPTALSKITLVSASTGGPIGTVQASNDNANWNPLASFSCPNSNTEYEIELNNLKKYNYYRMYYTGTYYTTYGNYVHYNDLKFKKIIESTEDNYTTTISSIVKKEIEIDEETSTTNYYKVGASNITVSGSLTNNKGILSGFSFSNYARTNPKVADKLQYADNWDMVFKITYRGRSDWWQVIYDQTLAYGSFLGILDGYIGLCVQNNGSYIVNWMTANTERLYEGETCLVRASFDGDGYSTYVWREGSTNWRPLCRRESSVKMLDAGNWTIGCSPRDKNYAYIFQGQIHLPESYIKANDKTIWKGCDLTEANESDYDLSIVKYNYDYKEVKTTYKIYSA